MIKAYIQVVELTKKDGTPHRRLSISCLDQNTGELFELFNVGMSPLNLDLYDVMIDTKTIIDIPFHEIEIDR